MGEVGDSQATLSETDGSTELSINNAAPTSVLNSRSESLLTRVIDDKSHASVGLASDPDDEAKIAGFHFLKLPAELRVRIYRYLLHACRDIRVSVHDAEPPDTSRFMQRRRFQYRDVTRAYEIHATGIRTEILSVNRQTYLEGSRVLYSENYFNFRSYSSVLAGGNTLAIVPFLKDRSEGSRRLIKQIEFEFVFTERLPRYWYFARMDDIFGDTCNYLSQNLQLEHITITSIDENPHTARTSTTYKSCSMNLHELEWVRRLVPLVKNLDTFTIIPANQGHNQCKDDLVRAAQKYLESKMHMASKTVRQSQIERELAEDAEVSQEQQRLEL